MKIPLEGYPYMNTDDKVSMTLPSAMWDGYCEVNANFVLRPGLTRVLSMGTSYGTRGIYWWESQQQVVVFNGGKTYLVDPVSYAIVDITGGGVLTNRDTWVSWCDLGDSFAAAAGAGVIRYTAGNPATTWEATAGFPNLASSVAFHDGYILANQDGTQEMRYIDLIGGGNWATVQAEGKPDDITVVKSRDAEIFLFGTESIEFWWNDGVTPFSRQPGTSGRISKGCSSPQSIENIDGDWYWLTTSKEVVQLVQRQMTVLSIPIQSILDSYAEVTDAKSFQLRIGGKGFYGLHFPTYNATWVYDYQLKGWSKWSYYNPGTRARQCYMGSMSCYIPTTGKWLSGSTANDLLFVSDTSIGTDDGNPVYGEKISGWDDSNTSHQKLYSNLQIQVTKGQGITADASANISYLYKNDGDAAWRAPIDIDIAAIGDATILKRVNRLGKSRLRKHRLRCASGYPVTVSHLSHDILDLGK